MGLLPALKLLFAGLALVLVLTFTAPHPVLAVLTVLVWAPSPLATCRVFGYWW